MDMVKSVHMAYQVISVIKEELHVNMIHIIKFDVVIISYPACQKGPIKTASICSRKFNRLN